MDARQLVLGRLPVVALGSPFLTSHALLGRLRFPFGSPPATAYLLGFAADSFFAWSPRAAAAALRCSLLVLRHPSETSCRNPCHNRAIFSTVSATWPSRCLAKNSNDRYATASALAADLKAIREGRPVAAKPMPGASLGDTVIGPAPPVSGPVAGTMATSVPPAQPAAAPAATIPLAALSPSGRRRGRWAAVAVAALALVAGGYWWKSAGRAGAPAAASVAAPSRPNTASRGLVGSRLAASATLRVICEHNFRSASLQIFSDGESLLNSSLHGERQDFGVVHVFKGRTVTSAPIAAGRHVLSVRISSREEDYEDQAEISGYFAENSTHTLLVDFGKGSGIGLTGRKLGLSWR